MAFFLIQNFCWDQRRLRCHRDPTDADLAIHNTVHASIRDTVAHLWTTAWKNQSCVLHELKGHHDKEAKLQTTASPHQLLWSLLTLELKASANNNKEIRWLGRRGVSSIYNLLHGYRANVRQYTVWKLIPWTPES